MPASTTGGSRQQTGAQAYASVEQKAIEYVQHAVVNVTTRIERPHSLLLPSDDEFLKFNVNALLRGDTNARAQFYGIMLQNKVMTRDEVREKEDLPYLGELGWLETPNNTGDGEPAQNAITVSDVELRDEAAAQLSDSVAMAVEASGERVSTDLAQMHLDMASLMERQERQRQAEMAAFRAEREAEREHELLPGEKRVLRDADGRIAGIVERKGDQVWRQVVERDAQGKVISIKQVAA